MPRSGDAQDRSSDRELNRLTTALPLRPDRADRDRARADRRRVTWRAPAWQARRGGGRRAVRAHAAHDPLPAEVPALVVRLERAVPAVQPAGGRVRGAPDRRLPVHRRGAVGAPEGGVPRREEGPLAVAAAREVVPRHPALLRAGLPRHRRLGVRSSRGSRSSSPAATRRSSRRSWRGSCGGACACAPTPSCSSPTSTRPSPWTESPAAPPPSLSRSSPRRRTRRRTRPRARGPRRSTTRRTRAPHWGSRC